MSTVSISKWHDEICQWTSQCLPSTIFLECFISWYCQYSVLIDTRPIRCRINHLPWMLPNCVGLNRFITFCSTDSGLHILYRPQQSDNRLLLKLTDDRVRWQASVITTHFFLFRACHVYDFIVVWYTYYTVRNWIWGFEMWICLIVRNMWNKCKQLYIREQVWV